MPRSSAAARRRPGGRIVIHVDAREPVSGAVRGAGSTRQFEGWLQLLAALEKALDEASEATPNSTASSGKS